MLLPILILLITTAHTLAEDGYIWILADLHYDPTYLTSQESCNKDIPAEKLGQFGDVECDPPWALIERAVEAMTEIQHTPNMIFWIGDATHHAKNKFNITAVQNAVQNCTNLVKQHFAQAEVYPIMGNHDYFPTNDLPGENNAIYNTTADLWYDWLREEGARETFRHASYYTLLSKTPKLRIVALNTNLYLTYNNAIKEQANLTDPGQQFEWLDTVLTSAKNAGEKVQIVTHVPSGTLETDQGVRWLAEKYNTELHKLYRKHSDVIIAIHAGHEHMDSFRLLYKPSDVPAAMLLVSPSVTPWRARVTPEIIKQAHNPALRAIQYDKSSLQIKDIHQYYLNLTDANRKGNATWELEYSFSSSYNIQEVTPNTMHSLLTELKNNPVGEKFKRYYDYVTVKIDHPESVPDVCDCKCRKGHLCSIEQVDVQQYNQCLKDFVCGDTTIATTTVNGVDFVKIKLFDLFLAVIIFEHFL